MIVPAKNDSSWPISIILLLLGGGLVFFNWWMLQNPVIISPIFKVDTSKKWRTPDANSTTVVFMTKPLRTNNPILSRPVFTSTRRPPSIKPKPMKTPILKKPIVPTKSVKPKILGIMMFKGENQVFLKSPRKAKGVWIKAGEIIDGWKIMSIDDTGATLNSGPSNLSLKLYVDKR